MRDQIALQSARTQVNLAGLSKTDYRGNPSTLCQGCGHNSVSSQIIAACYELNIVPENVVKFSGIGCSSKSPTYFLNRSFGFNGLHGRMPSLATGALFGDITLKGLAVSGDGDTASIGRGQLKHILRRNMPLVYIIENNGVYGLTKGQFSATAEEGLTLKKQGTNPYLPVDIAWEALVGNATFVALSFAGDPKQVKELIKAAISHRGIAVSTFSGDVPYRRVTKFEVVGDAIKGNTYTMSTNKPSVVVEYTARFDGTDYPISNSILSTVSLRRVDDQMVERTGKIRGQVVETETRTVSDNGKVLTVTTKGNRDGTEYSSVQVFDRQP